MIGDDLLAEYSERFLEEQDLEQKWIKGIRERVEELLEKDPGLLFSHLYRLDVDEKIIRFILDTAGPEQLSESIALEIWKRQKARALSRKDNPQNLILDSDF